MVKKNFKVLYRVALIASVMTAASCVSEMESPVVEDMVKAEIPFTVYASTNETKTVNEGMKTKWVAGDQLKLSYMPQGSYYYTNLSSAFTTLNGDGQFDGNLTDAEAADIQGAPSVDWVAVYPYTEGYDSNIIFPGNITQDGYDSMAHLSGANCPLYGEAKGVTSSEVPSFQMSHMSSVIEVTVTNASEAPFVLERVAFSAGNEEIVGSFFMIGEEIIPSESTGVIAVTNVVNGTEIAVGEAVKVYVVVKPFTAKAAAEGEDANILTFWVNNTPVEKTVAKDLVFSAGKIKRANVEYTGDFPELYVEADATAYLEADRIIPSLNNINLEAWATELYERNDTRATLEQAVYYLTRKNFELFYETLGSVPGFVKDTKTFAAKGSHVEKVQYNAIGYLESFIEDIENINDIPSLLAFLTEFDKIYVASGAKDALNEAIGTFGDYIDAYIEDFVQSAHPDNQPELDEAAAFAAYKSSIETQLQNSITGCNAAISAIDTYNNTIGKWTGKKGLSERASLVEYIADAEQLLSDLAGLETKEAIEERIRAIDPIEINIANLVKYDVDPESFLDGANKSWDEVIKEQIAQNETAINIARAALKEALAELQDVNIVESLQEAVDNPDSLTSKFLVYLFSQESFLETVKSSLRDIITDIEEDSKGEIDSTNASTKATAINNAKSKAILYARAAAMSAVDETLDATNENNLNNLNKGAWGYFKSILNWDKCKTVFEEIGATDIYDALVDISVYVEQMVAFENVGYTYAREIEDYVSEVPVAEYDENTTGEDWRVLKPEDLFGSEY